MNIEDEQDAEFQQKQLSDRTSALIDHFMEDGGFNLKTEEDEGDVSEENHLTGSTNQNLIEEKVTTPPAKMPTSSREEISKGEEVILQKHCHVSISSKVDMRKHWKLLRN